MSRARVIRRVVICCLIRLTSPSARSSRSNSYKPCCLFYLPFSCTTCAMASNTEKAHPADADHSSLDTAHNHTVEKSVDDPRSKPFSSGFFDKDPATTQARKAYLKVIVPGTILISIAIFAVLSIYWGALWKTFELTHNLHGWVVVSGRGFLVFSF